jgi:hypothetical protein
MSRGHRALDVNDVVHEHVRTGGNTIVAEAVRIDPAAHAKLRELAALKDLSLAETLSLAIEALRREVFLDGLSADFAALRSNASAWRDEQAEREAWDATLGDDATE